METGLIFQRSPGVTAASTMAASLSARHSPQAYHHCLHVTPQVPVSWLAVGGKLDWMCSRVCYDCLAQSTFDHLFVHDLAVSIGWETEVFPYLAFALRFSQPPS